MTLLAEPDGEILLKLSAADNTAVQDTEGVSSPIISFSMEGDHVKTVRWDDPYRLFSCTKPTCQINPTILPWTSSPPGVISYRVLPPFQ